MIVELVTFKSPAGLTRDQILEDAKSTIPKWAANRDLVRKHFLAGIGDSEGVGAGVYIWPSIEAAKAAHDETWRESVRHRTGGYPTIAYFDLMLLVDNKDGVVTEWDAGGKPRELSSAT